VPATGLPPIGRVRGGHSSTGRKESTWNCALHIVGGSGTLKRSTSAIAAPGTREVLDVRAAHHRLRFASGTDARRLRRSDRARDDGVECPANSCSSTRADCVCTLLQQRRSSSPVIFACVPPGAASCSEPWPQVTTAGRPALRYLRKERQARAANSCPGRRLGLSSRLRRPRSAIRLKPGPEAVRGPPQG
jgi:hypothetical protein